MNRLYFSIIFIFSLTACGSSPKTHFYDLNANIAPEKISEQNLNQLYLGIWTVKLPSFLDRPEMVTRIGTYGIDVADFHRWAGGFRNNITRLISSELSRLLKTDQVIISPWLPYQKLDYQIRITISQFDGEAGKEMFLTGSWSLFDKKGNKEILRHAFNYKTPSKSKSYTDMVAAFSELTIKLSEQIANAIIALR